ncbi:unnamed protein product [Cyprideis torosa]|uniref:Uncharacterized protein n=1 Tax=Cyprideis torosa TaxID=163714 RepID=A0A7R8WHU4_9CRUS|nr:unnamed protein product [Cyprideis torosa]CAG0899861.1 unnamed protein product [Cyprideis torosa]
MATFHSHRGWLFSRGGVSSCRSDGLLAGAVEEECSSRNETIIHNPALPFIGDLRQLPFRDDNGILVNGFVPKDATDITISLQNAEKNPSMVFAREYLKESA